MRQQFQRSLEDVKELLQQVDLESMANTIEEVAQVVDSIHDLEAMFEAAGRDPEGRDPESCEEQARQTLEVAANCIPNAVDAINRCRSPNTATKVSTALQDFAGFTEKSVALGLPLVKKKKPKGQTQPDMLILVASPVNCCGST
ncbi:unnamed protein product [Durusdinium trenchii]|uniref:Uncharacterized protein n=1 Tax=Durusdinium trenchii TaxID=1381693 RepID=A0ABP0H6Q9_9DINO